MTPRTYPVVADTNVADLGSNPRGTEEPAGSVGLAGVVVVETAIVVGVEVELEVELATRLALVVGFVVTEPSK